MSAKNAPARQIAALPLQWDAKGKLRVLMVTSRETGRWVMPKGWLMDKKKPWHAAKIEALEEAGAVGFVSDEPLGTYHYLKINRNSKDVLCRVTVYPMEVERLKKRWKERHERKRHWFSLRRAADLVHEPELSALLRDLANRKKKDQRITDTRRAP